MNLNLGQFVFDFFRITSLGTVLRGTLAISLILAGFAFTGYLVWKAIAWITAGGDKNQLALARTGITNAAIGLTLVAVAWAIYILVVYLLGLPITLISTGTTPPPLPSPTPTPPPGGPPTVGCYQTCNPPYSYCENPWVCSGEICVNPNCPGEPDCVCPVPTVIPTPTPTPIIVIGPEVCDAGETFTAIAPCYTASNRRNYDLLAYSSSDISKAFFQGRSTSPPSGYFLFGHHNSSCTDINHFQYESITVYPNYSFNYYIPSQSQVSYMAGRYMTIVDYQNVDFGPDTNLYLCTFSTPQTCHELCIQYGYSDICACFSDNTCGGTYQDPQGFSPVGYPASDCQAPDSVCCCYHGG